MTIHEKVLHKLCRVCSNVAITFSKDWGQYTSSIYWVPAGEEHEVHAEIGTDDCSITDDEKLLRFCEELDKVLDKVGKGIL